MLQNSSEIRGKLVKKGGKHLTLPGKMSFSVTLDLFFPKLSKKDDFL
jgi:hypothetical protein